MQRSDLFTPTLPKPSNKETQNSGLDRGGGRCWDGEGEIEREGGGVGGGGGGGDEDYSSITTQIPFSYLSIV